MTLSLNSPRVCVKLSSARASLICPKRPSRLSEEKKEIDNETDREALAVVVEKKVENHKFPNDNIEFNEASDTYIALLSFMPVGP